MSGQPHTPTELTSGKMWPTNIISIEGLTDPRHDTEQTAEIKNIYLYRMYNTDCTRNRVPLYQLRYPNYKTMRTDSGIAY